MLRVLLLLSVVLTLSGCGKKAAKPNPEIEAAMQTAVTCIRCSHTAPRITFKRLNQVLVQCPKCRKGFPAVPPKVKKNGTK